MQRMRGDGGCRTASQRQLTPPPAHKAAHQGAHELKGASYQGGGKPGAQAAVRGRKPGGGRGRRVGLREGGHWRHRQLAAPPAPAPGCWTGAQELRGASNQASRGPEPEQTALQAAGCAGRGRGKESGVDARELGGAKIFALGGLHRRHYTWRVPQVPRADQMKPTGRAEQRMGKEAGCKCEPHRRSPSATKALVQRQLLRQENRGEERRVLHYGRREGRECYTRKEPTRCSHAGPAADCRRAQELKGASYQAGGKQPA